MNRLTEVDDFTNNPEGGRLRGGKWNSVFPEFDWSWCLLSWLCRWSGRMGRRVEDGNR